MKRKYSLKKNIEFRRVYDNGKKYWNRNLILYTRKNKLEGTRVGFTITKRHGNAVIRNKIRRRMKEAYRLNLGNIKNGYDLVFIPKTNVINITYKELESSIVHIMKIANILKTR